MGNFIRHQGVQYKKGYASMMAMLLLSMVIAVVGVVAMNTLSERRGDIQKLEFEFAKTKLKTNLERVYNDPSFLNGVFLVANRASVAEVELFRWGSEEQEELASVIFPHPHTSTLVDPQGNLDENAVENLEKWIGEEVSFSYPNLEPCQKSRRCPIHVELVEASKNRRFYIFNFQLKSLDVEATGPLNPKKPENQFQLKIDRGYEGLVVGETEIYCEPPYAMTYFHTPPLEMRCRLNRGEL